MAKKKYGKEYIQGVPELLVLRLLEDKEMYGYEIIQAIRLRSRDAIQFGEGVIYPLLHSLQKRKLVAIRKAKVQGRPRIYYRLTRRGQKQLQTKVSDWTRIAEAIHSILDGGIRDSETA